jgi:hypothetical protein
MAAAHEFGHNLGVLHAGFLNCGASSLGCSTIVEYGDTYDVMGGSLMHMNAKLKDKIGYFSTTTLKTVTASGRYTLEPYETATNGVKALKILRGSTANGYMYIEYRQPTGFDSNIPTAVSGGALMHIDWKQSASGGGTDVGLIDASPPTNIANPALLPGQSFTDATAKTKITVVSQTPTALTVDIAIDGSAPPPTTPVTPPTLGQGLNLTLFLHGIGKAGDNANKNAVGNNTPLHPQRQVTLEFYNSSNVLFATKLSTLNFLPAGEAGQLSTGSFTGAVDVSTIPAGTYTAKIKSAQYLKKSIPGIITLPAIASATVGPVSLVTGDANNDNQINALDYNILIDCFSSLTPPKNCADAAKKQSTDLTDDGNVNEADYTLFLRELSVQVGE